MKKKLVLTAAVIAALSVVSCNGKKTNNKEADQDSLSYAEKDSLNSNDVVLDSIAGTYEGTLPAADCPGIKTVLTLNADSTYQYSADYLERKDGHDEASGIFKVLRPCLMHSKICFWKRTQYRSWKKPFRRTMRCISG